MIVPFYPATAHFKKSALKETSGSSHRRNAQATNQFVIQPGNWQPTNLQNCKWQTITSKAMKCMVQRVKHNRDVYAICNSGWSYDGKGKVQHFEEWYLPPRDGQPTRQAPSCCSSKRQLLQQKSERTNEQPLVGLWQIISSLTRQLRLMYVRSR